MWSDPNLRPFMAVTAHWIEGRSVSTPQGPQWHALSLRTELIGFLLVPGRHSGEHLAHALLYLLNRYDIISRVSFHYPSSDKVLMTSRLGGLQLIMPQIMTP